MKALYGLSQLVVLLASPFVFWKFDMMFFAGAATVTAILALAMIAGHVAAERENAAPTGDRSPETPK